MEHAHPSEGGRGLRKQPGNGRKPNEQNRHEHEQSCYQAANFDEPGARTAQASKNVKAGQTKQSGDQETRGYLDRSRPELVATRKSPDHNAINEAANN